MIDPSKYPLLVPLAIWLVLMVAYWVETWDAYRKRTHHNRRSVTP